MSKTYVLLLALVCSIGFGMSASTFAQQSGEECQSETDQPTDNVLADIQDSLLLDAFPLLRTLIDLISELIDLLNQADQLINGGGTIDPGTIDPGTIDPGTIDPGTIDPGTIGSSTIEPGGWGEGPVPSVP